MTELKRCPFCGGEAGIIKYMDGTYCVECKNDNCNMIAMTVLADTEARAVEIWNTRPNPWHTGTPTEEGWYLLKIKSDDEIVYDTNYLTPCVYGMDWRYAHEEIIEWQKIEEKENGHAD